MNPSGRPRGAAGLAKYIAEQTADGRELVDRLLQLSRDPHAPQREAFGATTALLDRLVGRPMQPSEITMQIDTEGGLPDTWSDMTDDARAGWLNSITVAPRVRS